MLKNLSRSFGLWFILRIAISLLAAYFSSLRPVHPIEKTISLWPPTGWAWLDRIFLSPMMRWDSILFARILENGYQSSAGLTQFHPLFIWVSRIPYSIGIDSRLSLLIISSLSSLGFLVYYKKLAALDLPNQELNWASHFLLLFPLSTFLFIPYTEAMFLFLSAMAFYYAYHSKWLISGLASALAYITRQQGILLLLPLTVILIKSTLLTGATNRRRSIVNWASVFIPMLIAEVIWIYFRWRMGDFIPDFRSIHSFIYSVFITKSATEVVAVQSFMLPWDIFPLVLNKLLREPDFDLFLNCFGAIIFIAMFIYSFPKMRVEYRLYCAVIIIVSLSYYTGPIHPYMGLLRHCYLAFPAIWGVANRLQRPSSRLAAVGLNVAGMLAILFSYVLEIWVP